MGCVASADWRITRKMSLAKCYLVFCGKQTPTFTYQTKSQSTFATKGKAFCTLHRNPCRAHITINDFQGGKCAKIFSGFCCCKCSPSPTKPSRQALLPQKLRFLESREGGGLFNISAYLLGWGGNKHAWPFSSTFPPASEFGSSTRPGPQSGPGHNPNVPEPMQKYP